MSDQPGTTSPYAAREEDIPDIRLLKRNEIEIAAGMVARAFVDLPTSVACFGEDRDRRARFLHGGYRTIFATAPELPLSAWLNGSLVGILGIQMPGNCQLPLLQKIRMAPFMIRTLDPPAIKRSLKVFATRDSHDARWEHIHLEPLAVEPEIKARRVGMTLCKAACDLSDDCGIDLFGITEKPSNVQFFESMGGELLEEFENIGLPNWAIRRVAGAAPNERLVSQEVRWLDGKPSLARRAPLAVR